MSKGVERMGVLELLPISVVQMILKKLDVAHLCSVAASCRILRSYAKEALQELECVHIPRELFLNLEQVESVLASNWKVKSLKLDCARFLVCGGLDYFTKPTLEELVLYNCVTVSSGLLEELGRKCLSLKSLNLQFGWREESCLRRIIEGRDGGYSKGLETVLEGCKQLESLCLRWDVLLRIFDREAFESIPRLTRGTLKSLELGFLAERDAKRVLELRVERAEVPQPVSGYLGGYPLLEKLCLALDRITDSLLSAIAGNLSHLKDLDLCDEPTEEPLLGFDLTNAGVIALSSIRGLRNVSLVRRPDYFPTSFKRVSDLGLLLLSTGCEQLECLRLGGFTKVTDAGCSSFFHRCRNLRRFQLGCMSQVTDLLFHDLSASPMKLECVALSSCVHLTDSPVVRLAGCIGLRSLDLSGCKSVGDESLKALSNLSQLEILSLNGTDVSDYGLWWLGQGVTPLKMLSLRHCYRLTYKGVHALLSGAVCHTLESLDLSGINSLTDDVTSQVVRSGVQLSELLLRDCPLLTCKSVEQLAESSTAQTLRVLDLWNSRGIKQISDWFQKPHFQRLRFLGVPSSMDFPQVRSLLDVRPNLTIKTSGRRNNDGMSECEDFFGRHHFWALTDDEGQELWIADGE